MNETFESLDELVKLFREIRSAMQTSYTAFSKLCNSSINASAVCEQLKSFETPLSIFTVVTEFIACVDRDRFVRKTSEASLAQDGKTNSFTDNFLAGIVFLDNIPNGGSFPKHVRYKIRMILDYVDTTVRTEDR